MTDSRNSSASSRRTIKQLASLGLVAIAYFVAIIVVLHFLRPEQDALRRPTSDYAVGPYGWLMTSALLGMALACLSLAAGLYRGVSEPARSRLGLALIGGVWVVGLLIAATFPIDLEGAPRTTSGTIHQINGPLGFLSLTIGVLLISLGFRHDEKWSALHRPTLVLALAMLALSIVNGASIRLGFGYPGLGQRILLAIFVTWFVLTAVHLRRRRETSRKA